MPGPSKKDNESQIFWGADPDLKSKEGLTALGWAEKYKRVEVAEHIRARLGKK